MILEASLNDTWFTSILHKASIYETRHECTMIEALLLRKASVHYARGIISLDLTLSDHWI